MTTKLYNCRNFRLTMVDGNLVLRCERISFQKPWKIYAIIFSCYTKGSTSYLSVSNPEDPNDKFIDMPLNQCASINDVGDVIRDTIDYIVKSYLHITKEKHQDTFDSIYDDGSVAINEFIIHAEEVIKGIMR